MRTITRITTAMLVASGLVLAAWSSVEAQTKWEFGVKGGADFANLTGTSLSYSEPFFEDLGGGTYAQGAISTGIGDMKTGFIGGGFVTAHITPKFGVRLEGLYAIKGSRGKNSGSIGVYDVSNNLLGTIEVSGENTATLTYFELPLLAVMSFPTSPTGTFELFAGPSLGFNSKAEYRAKVTLSASGQSQTESQTTDLSGALADTDFGGVLGVGYSHNTGKEVISLDARWTEGFSKIDDHGDVDWKNRNFSLMVGIGFPLGGAK